MYSYEEGYCKRLGYQGLWCVEYTGAPGDYHKEKMSCSCAMNGCETGCSVFEDAPEQFPVEKEWLLRSEQYQ